MLFWILGTAAVSLAIIVVCLAVLRLGLGEYDDLDTLVKKAARLFVLLVVLEVLTVWNIVMMLLSHDATTLSAFSWTVSFSFCSGVYCVCEYLRLKKQYLRLLKNAAVESLPECEQKEDESLLECGREGDGESIYVDGKYFGTRVYIGDRDYYM
jgi:hypothetical protein